MATQQDAINAMAKWGRTLMKNTRPFRAKVTAVSDGLQTCTVEPVDGDAECHLVALKPAADDTVTGIIPVPVLNSIVICGTVDAGQSWFVIQCSQVSRYIINAPEGTIELTGNQYSMVKGEVLQTELNKTKAVLDSIKSIISTWVPPGGADGGVAASTMFSALQGALVPLSTGNYNSITNNKVKHG